MTRLVRPVAYALAAAGFWVVDRVERWHAPRTRDLTRHSGAVTTKRIGDGGEYTLRLPDVCYSRDDELP